MGSPKISERDKLTLRNNAKAELERMEKCLSEYETVRMVDDFKNKFNLCETVYKLILAEHQKSKGKQPPEYLKIDMRQVPHALSFAGYSFDKSLLNELFGKTSLKGMTVKKLRDKVTHGIDENAIAEITERKEELYGYMGSFLDEIRKFDDGE
jgi:hypothetical protein